MKFDSESPYQQTRPAHDPETKLIVRCDNPFILAKDNNFMIDMLNIDDESPKERKHDHKSHFERKGSKVTCPPKQNSNIEDTLNINKSDDECVEALYSAPASGFEMVVKEDFYTDQIVTKAALPEVRVCMEDDPCHIVRDISIDEGLHFSNKSLVEKEEVRPMESSIPDQTLENGILDKSSAEKEQVGPIKSSISNKTINNECDDSKSVMAGSAGSDDSKCTVFDHSITNVNEDQSDPASVLHNSYDGNGLSVVSFDMLAKSNTSAKFTENIIYPASVIYDDYDGKESYASSKSNTSAKFTENIIYPASVIYDDYDGKESFASSINSEDDLKTPKSVACNTSAKDIGNQAVSGSDVHNDCEAKVSYVSSIDSQNKLGSYELVASNACGKVSSVSSINSEGNLDTKPLVADISTEVIENRTVPVSDVHIDSEGQESHNRSVDSLNKLDTYKSAVSNVSAKVVENQLPFLQEIAVDSSQVNSSIQEFRNDQKQSVDGQEFQTMTISEETNPVLPGLNFPSEVPAFSNGSKEVSASCKVPSGVITFSFDTESASTSGRDENRETRDNQKSAVAQNCLGTEEATIDGPSASVRCSSLRFIQEDSNLYGPALLSGHNANTGNISYSGSVSLRSESSTTSTRSFAFPILQSEWNSSPVKMAKADRRHKHRGWKIRLMCCRF